MGELTKLTRSEIRAHIERLLDEAQAREDAEVKRAWAAYYGTPRTMTQHEAEAVMIAAYARYRVETSDETIAAWFDANGFDRNAA